MEIQQSTDQTILQFNKQPTPSQIYLTKTTVS